LHRFGIAVTVVEKAPAGAQESEPQFAPLKSPRLSARPDVLRYGATFRPPKAAP